LSLRENVERNYSVPARLAGAPSVAYALEDRAALLSSTLGVGFEPPKFVSVKNDFKPAFADSARVCTAYRKDLLEFLMAP